jgi:hypothetical protein
MDEAAYQAAREAIGGPACVFERALLARCAGCAQAVRHALAEREAIGCRSATGRASCAALIGMLRERSAFALGRRDGGGPVPHATAVRLQCGGLAGVARATDSTDARDVHALVALAEARFGDLSELPWPRIVAAVAGWQGRRGQGARR